MTQEDFQDLRKYQGIPWVYAETDCWGLFKLITKEQMGVILHDLHLPKESSVDANIDIFEDEINSPRWKEVKTQSFGSAVVFYNKNNKAVHIGFCVDGKSVIHSMGYPGKTTYSRCDKIKSLIRMGIYSRYEFYNYTG